MNVWQFKNTTIKKKGPRDEEKLGTSSKSILRAEYSHFSHLQSDRVQRWRERFPRCSPSNVCCLLKWHVTALTWCLVHVRVKTEPSITGDWQVHWREDTKINRPTETPTTQGLQCIMIHEMQFKHKLKQQQSLRYVSCWRALENREANGSSKIYLWCKMM